MFHWFTDGSGLFLGQRVHANRGRSTTHAAEDFADPDFPARGRRRRRRAALLPWRLLELGGTQEPITEALTYQRLLPCWPRPTVRGRLQAADAGQPAARPAARGHDGRRGPAPAHQPGRSRPAGARRLPGPRRAHHLLPAPTRACRPALLPAPLVQLLRAAGADAALAVPATSSDSTVGGEADTPTGMHVMGGMRMGTTPGAASATLTGRYAASTTSSSRTPPSSSPPARPIRLSP